MKCLLVLLSFSSFCATAQSPDSLKRIYNNQTVYRYGGSFMKGGDRLSFGELQNEFQASPVGLELYIQAKKYRTTATVFRYVSLATGFITLALIGNNKNTNLLYVGLGTQFVSSLASFRYHQSSAQQMDRALWQRNKDVLFGQ